jgi:hypothetical protein
LTLKKYIGELIVASLFSAMSMDVFASNIISFPSQVVSRVNVLPSVSVPVLSLKDAALPNAMVTKAYSYDFSALAEWAGLEPLSTAPAITWSSTSLLPDGLSLNGAGLLSGTPTTESTSHFEIVGTHTDGDGRKVYTLLVNQLKFLAYQIDGGQLHTCAVVEGGRVKCWGRNNWRQLGLGHTTDTNTPVDVPGLTGVVSISAGVFHTCAVINTGEAKCWGLNNWGQLGVGDNSEKTTIVTV